MAAGKYLTVSWNIRHAFGDRSMSQAWMSSPVAELSGCIVCPWLLKALNTTS